MCPPGTKFVDGCVTKAGEQAYSRWFEEQEKRDQDAQDMRLYEDFNGCGIIEVMENQVRAWQRLALYLVRARGVMCRQEQLFDKLFSKILALTFALIDPRLH